MDRLQMLIDILIQYLNKQMQPISFLDLIVKYVAPFFAFGSAVVAVYIYRKGKNRDIYEKILKEVYAPLYDYFIKQELFCNLIKFERNIKMSPILDMTNRNQEATFLGLSRDNFLKLRNNVNIGLASKELHTLLTMYEVTCCIENDKVFDDTYCRATILKVKIENEIRTEILNGYKYYHKKLGLNESKVNTFCKIEDENIAFTYEIDDKEIEQLKIDINDNPERYR